MGGVWKNYSAFELGYHDALLIACRPHGKVMNFSSKNDTQKFAPLSQYTFVLAQLTLAPFPLASGILGDLHFVSTF